MRPRPSLRPTASTSVTAWTLDLSIASASPADINCPPKAIQSLLSCAMEHRLEAAAIEDEARDTLDIVVVEMRQRTAGDPLVTGQRDDALLVGEHEWLADQGTIDLELGKVVGLEALDQNEIDRRHLAQQYVEFRLRRAAMLVHERPALRRSDHDLGRAFLTMAPRILAGLIDVEVVMSVLHGRDAEAAADQCRQQPRQQRRLAAAAPTGEPKNPHGRTAHVALGFAVLIDGRCGTGRLMWLKPACRYSYPVFTVSPAAIHRRNSPMARTWISAGP